MSGTLLGAFLLSGLFFGVQDPVFCREDPIARSGWLRARLGCTRYHTRDGGNCLHRFPFLYVYSCLSAHKHTVHKNDEMFDDADAEWHIQCVPSQIPCLVILCPGRLPLVFDFVVDEPQINPSSTKIFSRRSLML